MARRGGHHGRQVRRAGGRCSSGPQGPPPPPLPELPKDFKPAPSEAAAIAAIAKSGVEVRPLAQNIPWREANFRLAGSNDGRGDCPLKDVTSLVELNWERPGSPMRDWPPSPPWVTCKICRRRSLRSPMPAWPTSKA